MFQHIVTALPNTYYSDDGSENQIRDVIPINDSASLPTNQHIGDGSQKGSNINLESLANSNGVQRYEIPSRVLRKIRRRYGDIDATALANIKNNPQAVAELDPLTSTDPRGLKKILGVAFLISLLRRRGKKNKTPPVA